MADFKPIQFDYEEVRVLTSSFMNACFRLRQSGDYPEKERDNLITNKLLDWLTTALNDINVATRGPKNE